MRKIILSILLVAMFLIFCQYAVQAEDTYYSCPFSSISPSAYFVPFSSKIDNLKFEVKLSEPDLTKKLRWFLRSDNSVEELTTYAGSETVIINRTQLRNSFKTYYLQCSIGIAGTSCYWSLSYGSNQTNVYLTKDKVDKNSVYLLDHFVYGDMVESDIIDPSVIERYPNVRFQYTSDYDITVERERYFGFPTVRNHYTSSNLRESLPIDPYTKIMIKYKFIGTSYNDEGELVPYESNEICNIYGAYYVWNNFAIESSGFLDGNFYVPGKQRNLTVNSPDPNVEIYWKDGTDAPFVGSSYTLDFSGKDIEICCFAQKLNSDYSPNEHDEQKYYCIDYCSVDYCSFTKADRKTVPAIDYYNCNTPYSMGNGVTVDLKTGDAKISQIDLILPGRGGLDLRLNRYFSSEANLRSRLNIFYWQLTLVNYHAAYMDYDWVKKHPWLKSFPSINDLKYETSESILTEPMPGWSYDLPRVTPSYVYLDGKLYPNCLEADRRIVADDDCYYFWAQGCEKIKDKYYYREGKFILTADGNNVILTTADGTSYTFSCTENEETGSWDYLPLGKISDKSGNQIQFSYGDDSATIVDSVGRTIQVTTAGIDVEGQSVVSFEASYVESESESSSDTEGGTLGRVNDGLTITYKVTDAIGRTNTMVVGESDIKLTSANGEMTKLEFSNDIGMSEQEIINLGYYFNDYGFRLIKGNYHGRDISLRYQFRKFDYNNNFNEYLADELYPNYYTLITNVTLVDGSQSVTANYEYQAQKYEYNSNTYTYSAFCPGPMVVKNTNDSYAYSYIQKSLESEGNSPINNQLNLVSSVVVNNPGGVYTRSYTYDDVFNIISETGPDGTSQYSYQTIDNSDGYFIGLTSFTHGLLTASYGYDNVGRLTSVTKGEAMTAYTYDANGNVSSITDPNGNVTSIAYDSNYNLYPATISSGDRSVNFEYDYPFGWQKSQTYGPYVTRYAYDGIGRLLTTTNSAGTVSTSYNDTALSVATTDAEGNQAKVTYDVLGRPSVNEVYDNLGGVLSKVSYSYDPQYDFRITSLSQSGIGTQTYSYNDTNYSLSVTDPDGNSETTQYDVLGRAVQVTSNTAGAGIETTSYSYDSGLLKTISQSNRTAVYNYNSRGLVTSISYNDGKSESFSYDGNGNPLTVKDRSGLTLTYDYNGFNEVTKTRNGSAVLAEYTYDHLGRLETLNSPSINYHNYYDNNGYLTHSERTIKGRLYDLRYTYGAYDRVTGLTLKNGQGQTLTQFGYDYNYPTTTIAALLNGRLQEFATITTGTNHLVTNIHFANGLSLDYAYGSQMRLDNRKLTGNAGLLQTHQYEYGPGGNIKTIDNQQYQYDNLNKLTSAINGLKNLEYEYDATGNRKTVTKNGVPVDYVYQDGLLKQVGNITFDYNADGSRKSKVQGADRWDYSYDNQGQLQTVTKNTEVIGSYGYAPFGWRIWKEENGKTNIYVRDGNQVYYQETFDGTSINAYSVPESSGTFIYNGNELLGSIKNGMEAKFYINDHLGTTELVTDINGNVISQIQHTPFGDEVFVQTGTSSGDNGEDYFFTGKEKDGTGLYYFGARYYDPEIGRFISEDPGQDGVDWFGYCRDNPINLIDPDGRVVQIPIVVYMYLTAIATSPDLEYDIRILSMDLAEGQYYAAAADIVGIALPGVPASVTNAPVKWLSKWLAENSEVVLKMIKTEGHHLWPKYLKGPSEQLLKGLTRFEHLKVHEVIDQFFPRYKGAEAYKNISPEDLYEILNDIYAKKFPHLQKSFQDIAGSILRNP